jgi:cell wall-associated NlpC family hydrolase
MIDVNDYIGIPFRSMGRGKDGLDCYGLVKLMWYELRGITLPDWSASIQDRDLITDQFENHLLEEMKEGKAIPLDEPEDWAIVYVDRKRKASHMGVFLHGGIIHCDEHVGVVYQSLSSFEALHPKLRFYRWQRV